ncbi:MAG: lysophospholipid acyltransferase family protein [Emcibacteraceae bacterium]|nr:lysophospholipid acyltransferase family protein [Emcibacteraceae bacterium]MDG1857989.1 lysophospholipid acyltransferase family protein [Emcibacteraceae bacterium]
MLRSGLFKFVFYLWTALFCILYIPFFWLSRDALITCQRWWSHGVLFFLKLVMSIRLEVRGLEHLPKGGAFLAMKHQSSFDTFVMHTVVSHPAFVMKKELLKIPLYGQFCKNTGMIPVDRDGGLKALKDMMQKSSAAMENGRQLIIFPEGSRTLPGAESVKYQSGIFGIYKYAKKPVVPVALNSGVFWPKKGHLVSGGTIVFDFLEPIEAGLKKNEFMDTLQKDIETASLKLIE